MTWMLDANVCIKYLNGRSPGVKRKLESARADQVCVSSVVRAELLFGAARSVDPAKTRAKQEQFLSRFQSTPFDDAAAEAYGSIRADLTTRGALIGPNDLLIAASCRSRGLTLVTNNIREFGRVEGLLVENWEDGASVHP